MRTKRAGPADSGLKRKLLYVVNSIDSFGARRTELAERAKEAGFEVHIAFPSGDNVPPTVAARFTLHPIALERRSMSPWKSARALASLIQLYRSLKPDLVHHFTIKPVVLGGTAARLTRTPAIHTITGQGSLFLAQGVRAWTAQRMVLILYRIALGASRSRVVFQNEQDRSFFLGEHLVHADRTVLIPGSGVDVARFRPTPEPDGVPIVIMPSRLLVDKGVFEFVEAARILRADNVRARFALVGDTDEGNPTAISSDQLRRWQEEGMVELWGWQIDMPSVYARSHVVCLPSYGEGLAGVLLEGGASGRALVATDVPGCRDVVIDRVTGRLVAPRDSRALAAALREVLADPLARRRYAEAARKHCESTFALDDIVRQFLFLYTSMAPMPRAEASA